MKAARSLLAAFPATAASVSLCLVAGIQAPRVTLAQQVQKSTPQAQQMPATVDDLNTYLTMGAINMCYLAQAKVPFKPVFDSTLQMIVWILTKKHGSKVAGAPGPLSGGQLLDATVMETVLRVNQFCGKSLSPDWKKDFDPLLAQVNKALAAKGNNKPGGK